MSLTVRILLALLLGLAAGIFLGAARPADAPLVTGVLEPVGGIWLDALRMTVIPLVFSLIVSGIVSGAGAASAGGIARKSLILFALILTAAGAFTALLMPLLLALWPVPAGAAQALQSALVAGGRAEIGVPPAGEWLREIIPTNPVAAAAEGAMLPLVVFAVVFGFALTRLDADARTRLSELFDAIVQAMLVIVHWILIAAPIGVFALSVIVGVRAGPGAAGTLLHYVILVSAMCIGVTLMLYAGIALLSRVSVAAFARAAAPAQAVAFSTQSSLASLPAMVEGVHAHMGVPKNVANLVLPLAVSLFRITSPAANLAVALYLAELYGIDVTLPNLIGAVLVAAVVSLASVGLPSQVSFFSVIAPVCMALGVPVEMLGLLLAVESVPDIFRTVGNVTADVAVTGIVGAGLADPEKEAATSPRPTGL